MGETKISRRQFLGRTALVSAAVALGQSPFNSLAEAQSEVVQKVRSARQPNIVFILADDLGWADLSVYGRPDYETRYLDKLAKTGVRLTQAYSNSAVCSPTRVGFLTGRYQQRLPVGLLEPLPNRQQLGDRVGLPPTHPTIASLLRGGGYHTALVGKWHVGYLPTYSPLKSGFEEFFGIFSGAVDYFTHKDGSGELDLWEDETPVERIGYITDLLTERAVEFINRAAHGAQPFYLSLHYTAPHWPWEGPQDEETSRNLVDLFHFDGGSPQIYAEIVKRLDSGVGRVLRALEDNGVDNDTLVVFTSDNGGERFSDIWPFAGSKGSLYEGGIRVPAIARWPRVLPSNVVSHQVAISFDWTATLLAAAGVSANPSYPLDGVNLLPYLASAGRGELTTSRRLFWRMQGQRAVREGNLKYLKVARPDQVVALGGLPPALLGTEFLFDLSQDIRERANLLAKRPSDAARLRQAFDAWNAQVLPEPRPGS
jgi:arylsulfatase A-like enzyme